MNDKHVNFITILPQIIRLYAISLNMTFPYLYQYEYVAISIRMIPNIVRNQYP